jgi:uncharacterized OB-fold protein
MSSHSTCFATYRDLYGHKCLNCGKGAYYPRGLGDLWYNVVTCGFCGHEVKRWQTKRGILALTIRHTVEVSG